MSDWAETRAAELLAGGWPPEGGSVSWLRYRSNIAKGLREAEARGRASMKEEAAKAADDYKRAADHSHLESAALREREVT
jgi:hypothetical protein